MDLTLLHAINGLAGRSLWLDLFGIFCSEYLWLVMTLGVIALLAINFKKWRDMAIVSIGSAGVARIVIVSIIKWLYVHPRPDLLTSSVHLLVTPDNQNSFPSGHATYVFALAFGVYLYNKKLGWLYFVLAALVSLSRVFVGVHWPMDIIAGALLGLACGWLGERVFHRFKRYFSFLK